MNATRPNCGTCGKLLVACASGWACQDLQCSSRVTPYGPQVPGIENIPGDLAVKPATTQVDDDAIGDCPECDGQGWVECSACDGTGDERCFSCGHDHECDTCGGDGEVECRDCHGSGWIAKQKLGVVKA